MGPIDFRENSTSTSGCILSACGHVDGISLHLSNDAYVQNAILVDASSGNSYIETDLATRAFIETGNSFAGLNLMNIVNTTVVNSNYLLVTLNAFRNILGDIIFPNWSYAPYDLSPTPSLDTTYIINTGNVENNISTDAHAGTNVLTGTNGTIHTGNAEAATNIFNMMNTSLIGGDSISILLNIRGAWIGDIFGLPAGMDVTRGLGGQYYITRTPPGGQLHASSILSATNTAIIQNDVSINARTGNNEIQGSETALITTGDAFTGANIVNIANTTIVGRNWTLAVLNIFGDFNGNIAFGRPDLWVGEQIAVPSDLENGKELVYTFTLMNNGDAEATRVTLIDTYDPTYLEIVESSAAFTTMGRHVSWEIPSLSPGESTEVSYRARVKNTSPGTSITNTVTVTSRETDNNIIDNTDTGTVQLHTVSTHSRGNRHTQNDRHISTIEKKDAQSAIKISVVRNTSSTTVSNTDRNVIQEVVIQNVGTTTIKGLIFHDILSDFAEQVIQDEIWDIGNLLPHEEVTLRYNISFEADAHSGLYTFSSVVELPDFTDVVFHSNGIVMLLPPMLNVLTSASSYAPISQKTIDPEVSVPMGLFVPIIAHAEESDQSAMLIRAGHTTISSLYVYILLMMVLISMGIYIHRRNL
jgi:uncharacterized repeat protein (TIGR01451 family)